MAEGRQRTLREAQAIARLSHPNVVVVYDVGTFRDQVFIAMEFVEGNTVTYWVESQARSWQEVLRVFMAAGRGLMAAHEKGLVHRDFKPDNVMVGKDGQVRVMDFGLARQMNDSAPTPTRGARRHRRGRQAQAEPGRSEHAGPRPRRADRDRRAQRRPGVDPMTTVVLNMPGRAAAGAGAPDPARRCSTSSSRAPAR
jgi:serine/threonine protein kinase